MEKDAYNDMTGWIEFFFLGGDAFSYIINGTYASASVLLALFLAYPR